MATPTSTIDNRDNDRDHYNSKPHMFGREKFEYWKDRIESYFIAYDLDLWDLVVDGYNYPVDDKGHKIARSAMTEAQKKVCKNIQS